MKILPPDWKAEPPSRSGRKAAGSMRYKPEFRIALFNQVLLLVVVC